MSSSGNRTGDPARTYRTFSTYGHVEGYHRNGGVTIDTFGRSLSHASILKCRSTIPDFNSKVGTKSALVRSASSATTSSYPSDGISKYSQEDAVDDDDSDDDMDVGALRPRTLFSLRRNSSLTGIHWNTRMFGSGREINSGLGVGVTIVTETPLSKSPGPSGFAEPSALDSGRASRLQHRRSQDRRSSISIFPNISLRIDEPSDEILDVNEGTGKLPEMAERIANYLSPGVWASSGSDIDLDDGEIVTPLSLRGARGSPGDSAHHRVRFLSADTREVVPRKQPLYRLTPYPSCQGLDTSTSLQGESSSTSFLRQTSSDSSTSSQPPAYPALSARNRLSPSVFHASQDTSPAKLSECSATEFMEELRELVNGEKTAPSITISANSSALGQLNSILTQLLAHWALSLVEGCSIDEEASAPNSGGPEAQRLGMAYHVVTLIMIVLVALVVLSLGVVQKTVNMAGSLLDRLENKAE